MNNESKARGTGLPLLFAAFLALCLFIFAAVCLMTASRDLASQQRYAERQTAYYEACNEAELKLGEIALGASDLEVDENGQIAFAVSIDDNRSLYVVASVGQQAVVTDVSVLTWQVVADGEWSATQSLPVFGK